MPTTTSASQVRFWCSLSALPLPQPSRVTLTIFLVFLQILISQQQETWSNFDTTELSIVESGPRLAKCCPLGFSVEENYGYLKPKEFRVGNLHCRPDLEAPDVPTNKNWIPPQLRDISNIQNKSMHNLYDQKSTFAVDVTLQMLIFGHGDVNFSPLTSDIPEQGSCNSLLALCQGFELISHPIEREIDLNFTQNGDLSFEVGGVEGVVEVNASAGTFCVDIDYMDHKPVVLACACPTGDCVQMCCSKYAQVAIIDSGQSLRCEDSRVTVDSWDVSAERARISPDLRWVPRSEQSLRRKCQYTSLDLPLVGEEQEHVLDYTDEEKVYVLKYHPITSTREFVISPAGRLYTRGLEVRSEHFCIAPTLNPETKNMTTVAYFCNADRFTASVEDVVFQSWFAALGAIFSLLTVMGVLVSPDLRRGVEGFTLLAHCLCMLAAYTALTVRPYIWTVRGDRCLQLALVMQFLLLSAFFWLNVRAVIIFTRFRSLETMLTRLSGSKKSAWLLPLSSLYAVGVPALVTVITAVAQGYSQSPGGRLVWRNDLELSVDELRGQPQGEAPDWLLTPDLDDTTCWFGTALGRTLYFTLPMGVVLLVNLGIFVFTVSRLTALTRRTGSTLGSGDDLRSDKQRLILFVKMFVIMGLSWSGEFLAFANYLSHYYWYFSTAAMSIRALAVFVIFCCRRKVFEDTKVLCRCCCPRQDEKVNLQLGAKKQSLKQQPHTVSKDPYTNDSTTFTSAFHKSTEVLH